MHTTSIAALASALNGEPLAHRLAQLLRLNPAEAELFNALALAEGGLSPTHLRKAAPSCWSPSQVAKSLNRKLAEAGLAVRAVNTCKRAGMGLNTSLWRLIDEPLSDAAA